MNIEELKKEYVEQDNRSTAFPIYVSVQELVCVGVMADGYSAICPYGEGENKIEYRHPDLDETFKTKHDISEALSEHYDNPNKTEEEFQNIEELNVGYVWHPVEFFLTIKGAQEYMRANAHNHGRLRTYVHHFERRNFEMRNLLEELGFKIKDI